MPLLAGIGPFGPLELVVILVIVVLIFGVGRLPEVGGALGKSIKEFRKSTQDDDGETTAASTATAGTADFAAPEAPSVGATNFCTECGASNVVGVKFCASCGKSMTAAVS